jgi:membrane protease YdiL (CAAX protease family)
MRTWFDHQITPREPIRYYLFALLVPNLVASAAMLVFVVEGVGLTVSVSPVNFLLVFGFTAVLLGALEEFGWRGFLQPALQARTTAVTAALLVGTVWGLWHVPSHLLGHLGDRPLPLFLLHLLPMSVVMAWLYNRCRGLLPVMVFHAAHNAPGNLFATVGEPPPGAGDLYYLVYTGIWILVGGMIVAYSGADLGSSGPMVSRSGFTLASAAHDR